MAGQFHAPSHSGVLKNLNMNGNIVDFLGVPMIVANIHWRKPFISS